MAGWVLWLCLIPQPLWLHRVLANEGDLELANQGAISNEGDLELVLTSGEDEDLELGRTSDDEGDKGLDGTSRDCRHCKLETSISSYIPIAVGSSNPSSMVGMSAGAYLQTPLTYASHTWSDSATGSGSGFVAGMGSCAGSVVGSGL